MILTSRRSGGTWLTDALAAEAGLLSVLQPFAVGASDPFLRISGRLPKSLYENACVPVRPDDEDWMQGFLADVTSAKLAVGWPANPFSNRFHARTDRVLVKLHNVKAWTEWIADRFPSAKIVLHFRHPIPQALSAMRSGWPLRTEAYLRDRELIERGLRPEQAEAARARARTGSPLEKALVNWLVENHVPLQVLRRGDLRPNWTVTTYEEAAVNPEAVFERLIERLELRCGEAVKRRMTQASHTVFDDRKKALIERDDASSRRRALVCGWLERVGAAERAAAQAVFDAFDLQCYSAESAFPGAEALVDPLSASRFAELGIRNSSL